LKKVLIVDDSDTIRRQVAAALRSNFAVLEAANGVDGLACAGANVDLSLILLDLNMPLLNGVDMLEQLKSDLRTREIPVLMLTTEAEPSLIDRARRAGASGWIVKPVKPDMLASAAVRVAR
jgi:two-component system chemotaxis response regulator CheY